MSTTQPDQDSQPALEAAVDPAPGGPAGSPSLRAVRPGPVLRRTAQAMIAPVAGLLVAVALIQAGGYQPLPTIGVGLQAAVGSGEALARTLAWGLPLYAATIGVVVAFRSGMFSVGAEGQVYVGALVGALVGAVTVPAVSAALPLAHLGAALVAAVAAAAAASAGLGWLRSRWNVDVVLSSLLANYVLVLLCGFLANGPFNDPAAEAPGATRALPDSARFAVLVPRSQLTWAVFMVAAACLLAWWLLERSSIGYRWRTVGQSAGFAEVVGMDVGRARVRAMAVSGGLCGLAGALLVTASQGRFTTEIAIGFGWIAVLLALIARARPGPAVAWVSVYAVMQAASRRIEQVASVSSELATLVICVVLVAAAASPALVALVAGRLKRRTGRGVA